MAPEENVERVIQRLKDAVGVSLDRELADVFDVDPSTVTGWRKRGHVPEKYRRQAEQAAQSRGDVRPVSPSFYDLRQGYVFALIGVAAARLRAESRLDSSDADNDVWYGFRLYKLHGELGRLLPLPRGGQEDKEALRQSYFRLRQRIVDGDLAGWVETLPVPMF